MIEKNDGQRRWSIGELAQATGVTVRALRHYDDIGLLRASERTPSSHRRYTADDLRRLRRVRALRDLDMSLEEIKGVLSASLEDLAGLRGLLTAQLDELTAQAEHLQQLIRHIGGLLQRLDSGSMPDPDRFMTTLEMIFVVDRYFTPELLEELARRRAALGPEAVDDARARGNALVTQVLRHIQDDTPVDDPQVQDLVRRWDELRAVFQPEGAAGEQVKVKLQQLWDDHNEELSQGLPWPTEQVRMIPAYLKRARDARSGR